jgi:hypothetical protein
MPVSKGRVRKKSYEKEGEVNMGKNDYLARQKAMQQAFFNAGLQSGRQQIIDMLSLVLRDPEFVDKDIHGKGRLIKVVQGIGVYIDKYQPAWEKCDEADYYQKKLDDALAEAYGEELHDSFHKRYEFAPEFDYTKGRWK